MESFRCRVCEEEVPNHPTKKKSLLDVLLAEIGICWLVGASHSLIRILAANMKPVQTYLYYVEKFRHNSSNTPEERWPARALHLVAVTFHFYKRALLIGDNLRDTRGVHLRHKRCEDSIGRTRTDYLSGEQLNVARKGARVGGEIFMRSELGRIHEDGDYGKIVFCERSLD